MCIGISSKSAEVIVACAFQAHFIKEVSRQQLSGAARVLLTKQEAKDLRSAEKKKFVIPLAMAFLKKKIVGVKKGSTISNLTQNCVRKIGTF